MKIYHTETQADYEALMKKLEAYGVEWANGTKITAEIKKWETFESRTCVRVAGTLAFYDEKDYYTSAYPNVQIIKYEAKADKKMKFTKENVEAVINSYFYNFDGTSPSRLIADIYAMYESDTVTEQHYTVVIADRYLVQKFIGRTDYRFVEFYELCAWKPRSYQLTEAEIKAIDERYWAFAAPVRKEEE